MPRKKKPNPAIALTIERLTAEDSPQRARLVEIWLDYVLALPLTDVVDAESVAAQIVAGMRADAVEAWRDRHGEPSLARTRDRWHKTRETPGDLLPPEAIEKIEALLSSPGFPRLSWARGAISPAALGGLLAPALQEVLVGFAKKVTWAREVEEVERVPSPRFKSPFGIRDRVKSSVKKGGEQLVGASKTVLDGIGLGVEDRVRTTAREFSDTASTTLRRALADRLKTDAGRELVAKMRVQVFRRLLETPLDDLAKDLERLDADAFWAAIADTASHLGQREQFLDALRDDIAAGLRAEEGRTLAGIMADAGDLDALRSAVIARGDPMARTFFASAPFEAWLTSVLE